MRRVAFAVALFAFTCHTAAQQPIPKTKSDLELIQGVWWIVGLDNGGKNQPEKSFRGHSFTFRKDKKGGDVVSLQEGTFPLEFGFTLDPAKTPKSIDLTTKGNRAQGIYKLDGDELTICVSLSGPRPAEFATKSGGDLELFTLRRFRWEPFTDKGLGFTVSFPGKPVESKRVMETPTGKTTTTIYSLHSEMERATYILSVRLVGKLDAKAAESALELEQQNILSEFDKSANARIESEGKPFKAPSGLSGIVATREFTIATTIPESKQKGAVRVRLFIAGERLFTQSVSGVEEFVRAPGTNQFWSSIRTPGGKKKDPPGKQ